MYREIRDPDNPRRMLFRYDPERALIEIKTGGRVKVIDLLNYGPPPVRQEQIGPVTLDGWALVRVR